MPILTWKLCLMPALCAAALSGAPQDVGAKMPARPEIRGTVLEPGRNQPVTDAEISLYFLGEEQPKIRVGLGLLAAASATRTDFSGAFVFQLDRLGYYAVSAKKEGYSAPGRTSGSSGNTQSDITLTAEQPVKEARLFLVRPARLSGRVVDEETGKPVANLSVIAGAVQTMFGRRGIFGPSGITDADGRFLVSSLSPGDYVALIGPQTQGRMRLVADFSGKDLAVVDQDYETTYWPGGRDADAALPVPVGSGATVNIGEVHVKKTSYYRVHVRIPVSICGPGETMQVYLQTGGTGMRGITEEAPCGKDMLIAGFLPGSYRLILAGNGGGHGKRGMASVPFAIGRENVETTAQMTTGVTVETRLVAADGARPPDYSKVRIMLYPIGMLPFIDLALPRAPDAAGKIEFTGVPTVRHQVSVSGLDNGHYVKELRYNGAPLADEFVPLDSAAMGHSLTVVIDDKPAVVMGSVTIGDKPVGQPYVLLVKWPPRIDWPIQTLGAAGDDKGRFQFAGLAPGEYRILALRSRDEETYRAAGTLERALAEAKKIDLSPNALQSVGIELSELR